MPGFKTSTFYVALDSQGCASMVCLQSKMSLCLPLRLQASEEGRGSRAILKE